MKITSKIMWHLCATIEQMLTDYNTINQLTMEHFAPKYYTLKSYADLVVMCETYNLILDILPISKSDSITTYIDVGIYTQEAEVLISYTAKYNKYLNPMIERNI